MIATREQLVEWIDAGIVDSAGLNERERQALREIALTTSRVARGVSVFQRCGCPAVQARLASGDPDEVAAPHIEEFMLAFDNASRDINATNRYLIEVEG